MEEKERKEADEARAALVALAVRIQDNVTPHDHQSVRFPRAIYGELVQAVRRHKRAVTHPAFADEEKQGTPL